jgi:hypothetical protein
MTNSDRRFSTSRLDPRPQRAAHGLHRFDLCLTATRQSAPLNGGRLCSRQAPTLLISHRYTKEKPISFRIRALRKRGGGEGALPTAISTRHKNAQSRRRNSLKTWRNVNFYPVQIRVFHGADRSLPRAHQSVNPTERGLRKKPPANLWNRLLGSSGCGLLKPRFLCRISGTIFSCRRSTPNPHPQPSTSNLSLPRHSTLPCRSSIIGCFRTTRRFHRYA